MLTCFSLVLGATRCPAPGACAANRVFRGFGVALAPPTSGFLLDGLDQALWDAEPFRSSDDPVA